MFRQLQRCALRALSLTVVTLGAGCASEPPPRRTRAPRESRTREPAPPPPPAWSNPNDVPAADLVLDDLGRMSLRGKEVVYLVPSLVDEREQFGAGVAVRIEAPPTLAWREVGEVLDACERAGLRNLHWKIKDDLRPALRLPIVARRAVVRSGRTVLRLREGAPSYTWFSTASRLRSDELDEGKSPPDLKLVELLIQVRESRARRVYVRVAEDVPFSHVFETADALRDTGTVVVLGSAR